MLVIRIRRLCMVPDVPSSIHYLRFRTPPGPYAIQCTHFSANCRETSALGTILSQINCRRRILYLPFANLHTVRSPTAADHSLEAAVQRHDYPNPDVGDVLVVHIRRGAYERHRPPCARP